MFERFTDRARRIVVLAQAEARGFNHNYIGTEHLLAAMVAEGECIAAQALAKYGFDRDYVHAKIETIIGKGQRSPSGRIPFTPRAKKVLELSLREALRLGHNYIGTEHILLGLLVEGEGVGAQIINEAPQLIQEAGVRGDHNQLDLMRGAVMALLGELPRAIEEPDYGVEVERALPADKATDDELRLINAMEDFAGRLRVHVENRGEIIRDAEIAWLTEMGTLGKHEAKEHETNQRLADLHARAVELAAMQGKMLAATSEFRQAVADMLPAPPSGTGEVADDDAD